LTAAANITPSLHDQNNQHNQIEYTVHKPALEEQPRHLLSAVSLGYNGRYNRLITVSAAAGWMGGWVNFFNRILK